MHPQILLALLRALLGHPPQPPPTVQYNPNAKLDTSQIEDRRGQGAPPPWPWPPPIVVPTAGHKVPVADSYPLGFPYFTPKPPPRRRHP